VGEKNGKGGRGGGGKVCRNIKYEGGGQEDRGDKLGCPY